jgi:hypothetical protein
MPAKGGSRSKKMMKRMSAKRRGGTYKMGQMGGNTEAPMAGDLKVGQPGQMVAMGMPQMGGAGAAEHAISVYGGIGEQGPISATNNVIKMGQVGGDGEELEAKVADHETKIYELDAEVTAIKEELAASEPQSEPMDIGASASEPMGQEGGMACNKVGGMAHMKVGGDITSILVPATLVIAKKLNDRRRSMKKGGKKGRKTAKRGGRK